MKIKTQYELFEEVEKSKVEKPPVYFEHFDELWINQGDLIDFLLYYLDTKKLSQEDVKTITDGIIKYGKKY